MEKKRERERNRDKRVREFFCFRSKGVTVNIKLWLYEKHSKYFYQWILLHIFQFMSYLLFNVMHFLCFKYIQMNFNRKRFFSLFSSYQMIFNKWTNSLMLVWLLLKVILIQKWMKNRENLGCDGKTGRKARYSNN